MKKSVYQEDNYKSGYLEYMKYKTYATKGLDKSIITFGNFSTSHPVIDRMTKQKKKKKSLRT